YVVDVAIGLSASRRCNWIQTVDNMGVAELQITRGSIQDDPHNRTRFAVIGRYVCAASGMDQTSLILSVPDKAGAVHSLIEPLARHGVSMKRFESRPARQGSWEYYFYIDIIGHQSDAAVAAALKELRQRAAFMKIVGSYPRASDSLQPDSQA
ncbi:MAG: ACT domain-containing protein, partial [Betaproteobacteria bacterium]|nr:ACT domain-containing protein [Betaproteobacteria bacterium]